MAHIQKSVDVHVPVSTAYNQWTQFEEFPQFMEGVRAVTQLDDRHLLWEANIGGHDKAWEAEIREQVPDLRIIWSAIDGDENAGHVTFEPIENGQTTRVSLEMSYQPDGFVENRGSHLGSCPAALRATSSASRSTSKRAASRAEPTGRRSRAGRWSTSTNRTRRSNRPGTCPRAARSHVPAAGDVPALRPRPRAREEGRLPLTRGRPSWREPVARTR